MKFSELIEIQPCKNMWGKRTGEFAAYFNKNNTKLLNSERVSARGKTKEEALNNLIKIIEDQFENQFRRNYVFAKDGTVFHLYYSGGWMYNIVRKVYDDGGGRYSTCVLSEPTQSEALTKMLEHVRQYNEVT